MSPASVLFGAAFTGLTILSAGLLILQALRLRLYRGEVVPLGFLTGAAALSMTVFLSCCVQLARPWFFAAIGTVAIALCLWKRPWRISRGPSPERLPWLWKWIFGLAFAIYGFYTFIYAMAPETSPDGVAYHLGLTNRYFQQGGFSWLTTNMYANLPMGIEMLFLFAFAFGRHSSAAMVHWQFLAVLPFLMLALGRRFGYAKAGAIAALLTFLSPVVTTDGSSAYVDVGTATVAFALFFALVAWEQERDCAWLYLIGIFAGFSYGCKMTGAPAIPLAVGFVAWRMWSWKAWSWRSFAIVSGVAFALVAPWLIKNIVIVGNPFSPFLNRYFPNPNVRISFEDTYREMFRTYYGEIKSVAQIPMEVTVKGTALNGFLGPIFLLAPIALLALRWPLGRRALIAAAFFLTTYPGNIGTRFLISPLPFVALGMGMVLANWRGMGTAVVLFHALLSWPSVSTIYTHPYAWRMDKFRWNAAWRRESEDGFLSRMVDNYKMAKAADQFVPKGQRIFTYGGIAESYSNSEVVIAYQGGFNNAVGETFAAGVAGDMPATQALEFRFSPRTTRRVRLVQTATTSDIWNVTELRALKPSNGEVSRDPAWRVRAHPNPWDVQWAFDNCPVSRWKAWEPSYPGEYIEIDFGKSVEIGGIRAETSLDEPNIRVRVDVVTPEGQWQTVSADPKVSPMEIPKNVRRIAMDDLKRFGFRYLIVAKGEFLADDVFRNEAAWGLTLLANTGTARLYRLD